MLRENWEYDVLNVYHHRRDIQLKYYFDYIKTHHSSIEGDIVEAGVFQGKSLLGMALLLKELGSDKKIYGFDSFTGFPPIYAKQDKFEYFEVQFEEGVISKEHYNKIKKNQKIRSIQVGQVDEKSVSLSGDFSGNSLDLLKAKISFLGLDNIELVPGDFETTMRGGFGIPISCVLFDCDLYDSYQTCLNFVWSDVSPGGMLYFDEYYSLKFPGARTAVDEFFLDKVEKPIMHPLLPGDFERWSLIKS